MGIMADDRISASDVRSAVRAASAPRVSLTGCATACEAGGAAGIAGALRVEARGGLGVVLGSAGATAAGGGGGATS